MENPLSLRLIKEEQESSEKLLELLVSSTHSPKGRFSKEDSYIMLKRKMETTKKENISFHMYYIHSVFDLIRQNWTNTKIKQKNIIQ